MVRLKQEYIPVLGPELAIIQILINKVHYDPMISFILFQLVSYFSILSCSFKIPRSLNVGQR